MYKNNSGLIAKTKVSQYKKGLCLTEKLVCENPLLFLLGYGAKPARCAPFEKTAAYKEVLSEND